MNLDRITARLPDWVALAGAKERKRRERKSKTPANPGITHLADKLLRVGDFDIRILSELSFRVVHWEIWVRKTYAFEHPSPDPFIVDCGSNIGLSVLDFKRRFPGARILAFEPNPEAFACLTENLERNRLSGVTAHNLAVADREGELVFHTHPSDVGDLLLSVAPTSGAGGRRTLPCVRLSRYLEQPVDYLKLDIEGAELAVLEELEQSGKLNMVRRMGIEYHHHLVPEVDELGRFLSILERGGFGYRLRPAEFDPKFSGGLDTLIIDAWRKPRAQ